MLQPIDSIKLLLVEDGYLDLDNIDENSSIQFCYINCFNEVDIPYNCRRIWNSYLREYYVFEDISTNTIYVARNT